MKLHDAARLLVDRAKASGQKGSVARPDGLARFIREKVPCIPAWYVDLITTIPICGLELGWKECEPDGDDDGINWMSWSNVSQMEPELECYPWAEILKGGFINVAADEMACGDPYFIPTDRGDDPPLFRVFHDIYKLERFHESSVEVSPALSEFFLHCLLRA